MRKSCQKALENPGHKKTSCQRDLGAWVAGLVPGPCGTEIQKQHCVSFVLLCLEEWVSKSSKVMRLRSIFLDLGRVLDFRVWGVGLVFGSQNRFFSLFFEVTIFYRF